MGKQKSLWNYRWHCMCVCVMWCLEIDPTQNECSKWKKKRKPVDWYKSSNIIIKMLAWNDDIHYGLYISTKTTEINLENNNTSQYFLKFNIHEKRRKKQKDSQKPKWINGLISFKPIFINQKDLLRRFTPPHKHKHI